MITIAGLLICAAIFTGSAIGAGATVTTGECIVMTWYGGAVGAKGKAVTGQIDSATGEGTYDWKNGKLKFSQLGDEGGRLNGMEGTWKQDGSEGSFELKGSYYDAPMVGTWSTKGKKAKNKLSLGLCKK